MIPQIPVPMFLSRPRVLLIDGSNISYIARYSKYRSDDELPDSPQGWLEQVAERLHWLMQTLGGFAFVFVMDGHPYERATIYPAYKGERDPDTPKGSAQWKFIQQRAREFLPAMHLDHYEADDLIARYCQRYGDSAEYELVICSSDKDMVQLLGRWNNLSIWKTSKSEWAAKPDYDQLAYRALIGDDSDNISGLTGDKTALKLLAGPAEELAEFLDRPYKPKARDLRALEAGTLKELPATQRQVYERNLRLMALLGPHALLPYCPLDPFPKEPTNMTNVLSGFLGRPRTAPIEGTENDWNDGEPETHAASIQFPTANPFEKPR